MNEKSMDIKNNSGELKIYFFTVQKGLVSVDLEEDVKVIIAYSELDAFNKIRQDYLMGEFIHIKKRVQVVVKNLMSAINIKDKQEASTEVIPPIQTPQKEKTAREFVYGMMLIADTFVTNKRDQTLLKRIIKKINYEYS